MKAISSRDNPLIKHWRGLLDDARYRRQSGASLLDGAHLLQAAADAGIALRCVAVTAQARARDEVVGLLDNLVPTRCELVELSEPLMRQVSPVETPSGIVAEIELPAASSGLDPGRDVLFLERIQDAGNLGTLLRTAAAAGLRQVKLSPACVHVWSPKVLRAGMGAHFVLGIEEDVVGADLLASWSAPSIATSLATDAHDLYALDLRPPCLWLFGSEGSGLSGALCAAASLRARIPMAVGSESLNVAAAAAVCLFEQSRQRRAGAAHSA